MTIKISNDLARHVPQDRIAFLERIHDSRAALLAEARAAAADENLVAWRPEATNLVNVLAASLANDESRVANFAALVPGLEAAARAELTARARKDIALAAFAAGSPDREIALKLRDDLDAAEAARGFAFRALAAAKASALALLPSSGSIESPPGADVVEALASYVINKTFSPEYAAQNAEAKKRWLAAPDSETMYWPMQALRLVKSAPREWEDARRVKVALPRSDFYAEFSALKAARQAHHLAKVRQAQTIVDNARAAVAAAGAVTWGEGFPQ